MKGSTKKFSLYTAIMIVIANMIGTGVFTSIGFQVVGIKSGSAIVLLWVIGGIISFFGAYSYAILGSFYKKNGGEYLFLKQTYSERLGFLSGWISFLLGFAAPIAAACFAFSSYFTGVMSLNPSDKFFGVSVLAIVSIIVLLIITAIHSFSHKVSAVFQNVSSTLKIIILLLLIIIGLVSGKSTETSFELDGFFIDSIWNKAFAFSLFFVTYSYSGWNAASYITGEVRDPERNVPIALIIGTGTVSLLYVLLNFVFLKNIPLIQMENKIEIGTIFTTYILGTFWGKIFGGIISFLLVSSISSMVIAGPRVTNAVANDFSKLSWFSKLSTQGLPLKALWVQAFIAILFILTSSFESMITMIGFVLNLFTMLTVIGAIKVGNTLKGERKLINKWVFPLFPLIFLLFQVWILIFGLYSRPIESCIGLLITLIGIPIYSWVKK